MRLRRPIAFILSAAVAASALTGCDSFSGHAAAAANSAQVQQLIEFIADLGLERDLRQALQSGGDLRQALLTLLGLESAVNFNVDDLAGARPGQHAVQVWEVTAQSAEDAAALAASQIRAVLEQLKSSGVTEGRIGMVEVDGKYYVVVDVEVTEENTFEPIRPASDDDDDNEDTPSAPAPTATVGGNMIDLSSLGTEITATSILNLVNQNLPEDEKYTTDSITELDLRNCTGLTSIGKSDDYLGAFEGCEKLTTVILPSSVTTIGPYAFRGCNSLTSINLSACKNLATIGRYVFFDCDKLAKINLSNCTELTSIGNYAFSSTSLTSINLGDCTNLTSIGSYAFSNTSLTSINLSGCTRLESIGGGAFGQCKSLTSINLSGCISLKSIDHSAFQNCASLETVLLPESLREIGAQAFWNCTGLKTVKLPAKLTTISGLAFQNCSGLENIYFYGTVVPTIGTDAFKDVTPAGLIIHYPSSWGSDGNNPLATLKERLRGGGLSSLSEEQFRSFDPNELSTLASFFGL